MSKRSQAVKDWRKNTKSRIVESMGGKCQICGYNKCNQALELHHVEPEQKELSFGKVMANPIAWESLVGELRKCILLCSCCHKEVHAELTNLPEEYMIFDESFVDYRQKDKTFCSVCGVETDPHRSTCSQKCAGSLRGAKNEG